MSWHLLVFLSLILCASAATSDVLAVQRYDPPTSRFAYVTVHYEGTSRDAEYVLGVQVMMHSIKLTGSPYDLVVLASDSVSEKSKSLFRSMGCRVLDVINIDNPFVGGTLRNKGFIYTLNKLHVWNMLEYERVVYLDADNVLIRNADELFLCGEFCAVFMNPCHFHTGLLVVTPSSSEYERLLNALGHLESFDGADQGFLSSMYSKMLRKAKLFTPMKSSYTGAIVEIKKPEPKGMRLPVGYNINHKYFYEQYHWKLYYLRQFASMTSPISPVKVVVESARSIPALTVGYPMASILKPWYWWAGFFMDLHGVWHDIRATLPASQERYGAEEAIKTLLGFFSSLALLTAALYALKITLPMRQIQQRCTDLTMRNNKQARYAYKAFRIALVVLAFRIAPARVHPLTPVNYGYGLMIFMNVFMHIYFACVISNFWDPHQEVSMPPVLYVTRFWLYVALTVIFEIFVVWFSTWNVFTNVLWRLFSIFWSLFLCAYWQTSFYRAVLCAEFGGKKEQLRSL
ncbi:glucuronosyltransferase pgsip8-like [Plasmopara halstedii]|uniref:Glucuronosyltransferase pgsip8-like n=1 Tax=Plasmopara halstedii TaxID=4781 RepID=A0A0P1AMT7_PLAHL|nr:glucuronosyltransferase pgsip8-like [Plasmopara halstedii]CEG42551.1 glucuronosyltransferase pgsip8-like [Plasmopara halstedii]|eukprot:XP_024578920.1 glucuronosyltransferase pgsip8-like [Plasmopara halstedii]